MKRKVLMGSRWIWVDNDIDEEFPNKTGEEAGIQELFSKEEVVQDVFRSRLGIHVDGNGKHRWKVVSLNGNIISKSNKGYPNSVIMLREVRRAKKLMPEIYRDSSGEWRWRTKEGSKILASSSEGHKRRAACLNSFEVFSSCSDCETE